MLGQATSYLGLPDLATFADTLQNSTLLHR